MIYCGQPLFRMSCAKLIINNKTLKSEEIVVHVQSIVFCFPLVGFWQVFIWCCRKWMVALELSWSEQYLIIITREAGLALGQGPVTYGGLNPLVLYHNTIQNAILTFGLIYSFIYTRFLGLVKKFGNTSIFFNVQPKQFWLTMFVKGKCRIWNDIKNGLVLKTIYNNILKNYRLGTTSLVPR